MGLLKAHRSRFLECKERFGPNAGFLAQRQACILALPNRLQQPLVDFATQKKNKELYMFPLSYYYVKLGRRRRRRGRKRVDRGLFRT